MFVVGSTGRNRRDASRGDVRPPCAIFHVEEITENDNGKICDQDGVVNATHWDQMGIGLTQLGGEDENRDGTPCGFWGYKF